MVPVLDYGTAERYYKMYAESARDDMVVPAEMSARNFDLNVCVG